MTAPYATIKFKIRLNIDGVDIPDVVGFSANWEVNTIPSAMLTLSVGSEVTSDEPATIHALIAQLTTEKPASVYLQATAFSSPGVISGVEVLDGELLIFEGYATGCGWIRTDDTARFTVNLIHWLADLNYASAISASSHPGNPGNWAYPASYLPAGSTTNINAPGGSGPQAAL